MHSISHGQRIDLPDGAQQIRISGDNQAAFAQLAPFLLPLGEGDRLCPQFPPVYPGDSPAGVAFVPGEGLNVDLAAMPADVRRLLVVLYVLGGPSRAIGMDHVGAIETIINAQHRFRLDLAGRREAALILVEFYRRGSAWRLAATGQGFTTGIPGITRAYGIELAVPHADGPGPDHADHDDWRHGSRRGDPRDQRGPPPPGTGASGSGFAIGPRLVMTNHHVIEHGRLITAAGDHRTHAALNSPLNVIASDPVNDIALIALDHDAAAVAQFSDGHDIDLGEDVIVAGFPLQGLLGNGPQISGGNISALTGIHGDATILQFNSPIGSGSSGGPMLNSGGVVVGLVRSVLNSDGNRDSIAQNINFGVKASVLRSFLHACGIRPELGPGTPINRAEIARRARSFLYRINVTY